MTGITTYLSILTLNVNGLYFPIKDTNWQTVLKRKIQQFAAYRTPTSSTEIALAESKRLEEDLPKQCSPKTSRSSDTYIRQSRFQTYFDQMI
jgi:hypothetical protein